MKLQVEGREVYAYTGGRPAPAGLPTVVFVHGALHDHSVWTLLARWHAHHGHAVLAPDLPAHGRSEGPPLPDVEAAGAWLLALLQAAGAGPAWVVGHSLGSLIALEAAARGGAQVQGLVMVGPAFPMKVSRVLLDAARDDPGRAMDLVNIHSHSGLAAKPSYPGPGSWLRGANRALMQRIQDGAPGNLLLHDFLMCDGYGRGLAAAAEVYCPALLVCGQRDAMTPPRAAVALGQALRASPVTLPVGHALMQEAPEALLQALRQVIRP